MVSEQLQRRPVDSSTAGVGMTKVQTCDTRCNDATAVAGFSVLVYKPFIPKLAGN